MAGDSQPRGADAQDLIGRWLAHHERQSNDEAAAPSEPAGPVPPAPAPAPVDPILGVAPPSTFGVRRPAGAAEGPVNELDRQPPPGWEPVLLQSVRKKRDRAEARTTPRPTEGPSRLARLKARLVDPPVAPVPPVEAQPEPEPELADAVILTAPPTPSRPIPAPSARDIGAEILAALAQPEPEPEPRPLDPGVRAVIAPPQPEPEPIPEPAPVAEEPEPLPDPEPESAPPRPLQETIRRAVLTSVERRDRPWVGDAARDLVAANRAKAKVAATPTPPAPRPVEPATALASAKKAAAATTPAPAPVQSTPEEKSAEIPGLYVFKPRRGSRRILTLVLLGGVAATAYAAREALAVRDTFHLGVAAIVVVTTAVVWAIRAGASTTKLCVRQGQLEVTRQGSRYVFDLASSFTTIEVHGRPGRRGWRVVFPRRAMKAFTVDSSMVDPHDFMRVLRFFRPEVSG